ncbi:MAG: hypothetical protein FJZ00_02340 [Candidatus Sericytochromatia bacterium]|uniref:DUF1640 domain-containing protein n=1 Tax=Candidatus Tanganyikabacteria bacterium TaxID=2961651 RepID=A0A938BMG8_9BACT|nr:hypothetical protein [Candidatus Tanganyikabacteria bacterium]
MASYQRETIDALIADLRAEMAAGFASLRAELATKTEVADLRVEMLAMEGRLTARIERMYGEWKVWFVVFGAIIAVVSSGPGARVVSTVWPEPHRAPPPAALPR